MDHKIIIKVNLSKINIYIFENNLLVKAAELFGKNIKAAEVFGKK